MTEEVRGSGMAQMGGGQQQNEISVRGERKLQEKREERRVKERWKI